MATSVPGSMAFSIRCEPSSEDVLRSRFVLRRGFPFASSNSLSSYSWLIVISISIQFSCQVPVPWQGAMTRLLLWHKEVQAKRPYPFNNLLHYFFSTFSIPSTSCSTKGPSLHSKMTLFGSSGSIVCHVPVPCHA